MIDNITGAEIVLKSLTEQGVEVVFGYPGGAVLPIYDSLFKQNSIRHILVRQEAYLVREELKVRIWFCELIISPFTSRGLNLILSSL